MFGLSAQHTQPPDLTSNTNTLRHADRVNRLNAQHAHAQSVRVAPGAVTGLDVQEGRGLNYIYIFFKLLLFNFFYNMT